MGYSRKRLAILGVAWLFFGLLVGGTLITTTGAEPNCDPAPAPCDFPAENYDGGIVLGTPELQGDDLVLFNEESFDAEGVPDYSIDDDYGRDTQETTALPAGAPSSSVDVSTVGFAVDSVDDIFFYKTWKTSTGERDVPSGTTVTDDEYDDIYVYVEAGEADLEGPDGEVDGIDCGEPDEFTNEFNPNHCDLTAELSEVAFNDIEIDATVDVDGVISDSFEVDDDSIDDIDEQPENSYWVLDPQADGDPDNDCEVGLGIIDLDVSVFPPGVDDIDLTDFCLGFIDVTFDEQEASDIEILGINVGTVDDFDINELVFKDLQVKGPAFFAESPGSGQEFDKELELNDFYAEIRWGKGHDRGLFPESNDDLAGDTERFGGPAPDGSDGETLNSRVSGLANPYPCTGNPTSIGVNNCIRDNVNEGQPRPGPYDDIYR